MKTYMFCNAHLDPVWLWQWEDGLCETLSTFRSAADLIDEYPELIFNHNESLLYEWVEEHDPELFERIRQQVSEGRWVIVGGWFLQPDCNIPSGEAIVRQALKGRLYFYDRFGKVPVTAVNMDPFGHAQGLVQVLKQCGYRYYVNIRPGKDAYAFDDEDFLWRGYDGSEIVVHRSDKGYNSVFGQAAEELKTWTQEREAQKQALYLWGVGNHGGGPSRKDLNDIRDLVKGGMDLVHASPDDYFAQLDPSTMPVVEHGLNPVAEGCYTSIIRIKQLHRQLENALVMTEKMACHAAMAGLAAYEKDKLNDAWRDLLFAEFHDSLPGSCIASVEEDTIRLLDHGLTITNELKAKYFLALTSGQKKVQDGDTVPVFVYNPHPFPYRHTIDVSFTLPRQLWHTDFSNPIVYLDGERVPCQSAKEESNFYMDWCKRVVFEAELPPASMTRFDVRFETLHARPAPTLTADANGMIHVETSCGHVRVNARTGLVDSYVKNGVEYLKPGSLAVEVYEDSFNSWGGQHGYDFLQPIGRFTPMTSGEATDFAGVKGSAVAPVRVTDEGEVRVVVEADLCYHDSKLLMRYIINKISGTLELETRVFFAEKEKRLKLHVNSTLESGEYIGQTMFGRERLDVRDGEYVSQYWQAIADAEHALTIIDRSVYGSSFAKGDAGLTLLRSAGYGASRFTWGEPFHDPMYQQRMEQGERRYCFLLDGGAREERLRKVDTEAAAFNQMPYARAYCPSGKGEIPKPLVRIDRENVLLSCLKQSERDSQAYVLRIFEAQGVPCTVHVELPIFGVSLTENLKAFEIKTYLIQNGRIEETDMLEGAVPHE